MDVIGLIGGMSWESTVIYYRHANELVRDALGGLHSAPLVLSSVDFAEIADMQSTGEWQRAGEALAEHARTLERAGASIILICTNTMHLVHEQVQNAVAVPVLHIADPVVKEATRTGVTTVGLLGTRFTMEQPFYTERLEASGIRTLIPDAADRATVHNVIFHELMNGQQKSATKREFQRIIERLIAAGAQAIVLACTELELLIDQADSSVPILPTARMHIADAVLHALPREVIYRKPGKYNPLEGNAAQN